MYLRLRLTKEKRSKLNGKKGMFRVLSPLTKFGNRLRRQMFFFPLKHFLFDHPCWQKDPFPIQNLCWGAKSLWVVEWCGCLTFPADWEGFERPVTLPVGGLVERPVGLKTAFFPCFFGRSEILEPEETICDYFCSMSEFNINIKGGNTLGWWLDRIKRRPFGLSIWGDNESTTIRVCYFLKFPLLDGKTVDCWMVAK